MAEKNLVAPFWFNQRQCKAENVDGDLFHVTAPNMPESYIGVRRLDNGRYQGYFRRNQDGPDDAVTTLEFGRPTDAWDGTFELFREAMIL